MKLAKIRHGEASWPEDTESQGRLLIQIAIANVIRRPQQFISSSINRLIIFLRPVFFLLLFCLQTLWRWRKNPGVILLGALTSYFSVHALLALDTFDQPRYLLPVLPLVFVLAGSGIALTIERLISKIKKRPCQQNLHYQSSFAPAMLRYCSTFVTAIYLWGVSCLVIEVARYAGPHARALPREDAMEQVFNNELTRFPTSAKLYNDRGVIRALDGRLEDAQRDFRRSLALDKTLIDARLNSKYVSHLLVHQN
jgi:hypothetical protein